MQVICPSCHKITSDKAIPVCEASLKYESEYDDRIDEVEPLI